MPITDLCPAHTQPYLSVQLLPGKHRALATRLARPPPPSALVLLLAHHPSEEVTKDRLPNLLLHLVEKGGEEQKERNNCISTHSPQHPS